MTLQERLEAIVKEARDKGYAITYWDPDEVDGVDVDDLLDVVVERGSNFIQFYKDSDEQDL